MPPSPALLAAAAPSAQFKRRILAMVRDLEERDPALSVARHRGRPKGKPREVCSAGHPLAPGKRCAPCRAEWYQRRRRLQKTQRASHGP